MISDPSVKQRVDVSPPNLLIWRPRRDLNPRLRRERATPWRLYKNLEGAGGAVRTSKTQLGVAGKAYRYMIVT
jgi:hypothetical protein